MQEIKTNNEFSRENDDYFYWLDSILNADDQDLTPTEREFKTRFLKEGEA